MDPEEEEKEEKRKRKNVWVKGKLCSVTVAAGLSKDYGVYLRIIVSGYGLGCPDVRIMAVLEVYLPGRYGKTGKAPGVLKILI